MSLYEFNVLIASGTGVMTAASVLKEAAHCNRVRPLVFATQLFNSYPLPSPSIVLKEVVFVWVVEDETGLEWLIDIIREVEDKITVATFITKLRDDFNFRTSMIVRLIENNLSQVNLTSVIVLKKYRLFLQEDCL